MLARSRSASWLRAVSCCQASTPANRCERPLRQHFGRHADLNASTTENRCCHARFCRNPVRSQSVRCNKAKQSNMNASIGCRRHPLEAQRAIHYYSVPLREIDYYWAPRKENNFNILSDQQQHFIIILSQTIRERLFTTGSHR